MNVVFDFFDRQGFTQWPISQRKNAVFLSVYLAPLFTFHSSFLVQWKTSLSPRFGRRCLAPLGPLSGEGACEQKFLRGTTFVNVWRSFLCATLEWLRCFFWHSTSTEMLGWRKGSL